LAGWSGISRFLRCINARDGFSTAGQFLEPARRGWRCPHRRENEDDEALHRQASRDDRPEAARHRARRGGGEAKLFLEAQYPDDTIEAVTEPADWVSNADTGSEAGDIREHPGVAWQAPSSLAG
jgi:hypothetical protein